jgi:hypothetical protein
MDSFVLDGWTLPAAGGGGTILKNILFEPLQYKTDLFTKTGSGQT